MADATYQPKVYRSNGGDTLTVISGGTLSVEAGATMTIAADATFTGTPDFSGATAVTMKAASVTAASLGANLKTGYIPLPIANAREIISDATINAAGNGGVLASDTTPIFERVNGATDKKLRLRWAASAVDEIAWDFVYPPDLDEAANVEFHFLAAMGGVTDTPTATVSFFEGVGDTNAGSASGAVTGTTVAEYSVAITAANVGATPKAASVGFVPGTHGTDTFLLYGAWIEYTRMT